MSQPKRKAADLDLPEKGGDAAERKRVLNVLAQRRYRQRRKEHVKKLEAGITTQNQAPETTTTNQLDCTENVTVAQYNIQEDYPPEAFEEASNYISSSGLDDILSADDNIVAVSPINLGTNDEWQYSFLATTPPYLSTNYNSSLTSAASPGSGTGSSCSTRSSPPVSFPDEKHLQILELNLLRGATAIASRLGISELIWSLDSMSPFCDNFSTVMDHSHLPINLLPTAVQRTKPHHPMFDLLPWPTVRDKLILIFSVPPEMRPAVAAKPTAIVDLVYDIEDSAEGVRIWGDDPYSDQNWEVGEKAFRSWWWAFDSAVIQRSNNMRAIRGAKPLGLETAGSVLGEVG
jgi:hypothetical protein